MYISNVAGDTTRLTYYYFIPILPFLYCLDPKSALTMFSKLLHGCLISIFSVVIPALYKTT